jgi:hypothetical protein
VGESHIGQLKLKISAPLVQNLVEYVVNLCGGSTRVRLARSVVGVITSRVLAVPSPDAYSPTLSRSDD